MTQISLGSLAGVPIFVSPFYGIILWFGFQRGQLGAGISWVVAVTLSLLVHEFGHALTARAFALRPWVILHGFGGLTAHAEADRDRDDALIVAAGPAAGLVLGVMSVIGRVAWTASGVENAWLDSFFADMIWINIGWSLINLVPIWPLDGGHLYRLALIQFFRARSAERITHITAMVLLAGALYLTQGQWFMMLICAYFMFQNYQALRGEIRSGPVRSKNLQAKHMLAQMKGAFDAGDFREAARMGQLIRQETTVPAKVLSETWELLGASTARLGEYQEALHYLQRAPETRAAIEAEIECYYSLGYDHELQQRVESEAFRRLIPKDRQEEILRVVSSALSSGPARS